MKRNPIMVNRKSIVGSLYFEFPNSNISIIRTQIFSLENRTRESTVVFQRDFFPEKIFVRSNDSFFYYYLQDTLNSVSLHRQDLEFTLTNSPLSRPAPVGATVLRVQPILVTEKRRDNDSTAQQQQRNASKGRTFSTDVISEGEALYEQSSRLSGTSIFCVSCKSMYVP